jgi:hypothetical protein
MEELPFMDLKFGISGNESTLVQQVVSPIQFDRSYRGPGGEQADDLLKRGVDDLWRGCAFSSFLALKPAVASLA